MDKQAIGQVIQSAFFKDEGGNVKGKGRRYKKFSGPVGRKAVGYEEEFDHCPSDYISPFRPTWIHALKVSEE